jgi:hypothetical protein
MSLAYIIDHATNGELTFAIAFAGAVGAAWILAIVVSRSSGRRRSRRRTKRLMRPGVQTGLQAIRSSDYSFNVEAFTESVARCASAVQEAWTTQDQRTDRLAVAKELWGLRTQVEEEQRVPVPHRVFAIDVVTIVQAAAGAGTIHDTLTARITGWYDDPNAKAVPRARVLSGQVDDPERAATVGYLKRRQPFAEDWVFERPARANGAAPHGSDRWVLTRIEPVGAVNDPALRATTPRAVDKVLRKVTKQARHIVKERGKHLWLRSNWLAEYGSKHTGDPAIGDIAWPLARMWDALNKRVEWPFDESGSNVAAYDLIRRAASEWLGVAEDESGRTAYFERWLYDECGYPRGVA